MKREMICVILHVKGKDYNRGFEKSKRNRDVGALKSQRGIETFGALKSLTLKLKL